MRKPLVLFLWGILSIAISVEGKSMDVPTHAIQNNGLVLSKIKAPTLPSSFVLPDSLKVNVTDTIHHKKHRLAAALLAFPLGVFGLHRMYLGTSVNVPFIYIVTIGGAFGILPFIDFVMILLSKNQDFHATYTGNPHLFMWQKK